MRSLQRPALASALNSYWYSPYFGRALDPSSVLPQQVAPNGLSLGAADATNSPSSTSTAGERTALGEGVGATRSSLPVSSSLATLGRHAVTSHR